MASLMLTPTEVDELCDPLTQPAAQRRHVARLFGLKEVPHRPDGRPLVRRTLLDALYRGSIEAKPASKFNWSK